MALQKLTIDQARANASSFLYIFADEDKFLQYIPKKYAQVIRGKKVNQNKVLLESARSYNSTFDAYASAIREGFMEQYDMTPANALVVLAQGGTVAGKNWSEGVFGVGKASTIFTGDNVNATVNESTGVTSVNGVTLGVTNIIYANEKGQAVPYQVVCTDNSTGITYVSQLKKGKYYAQSYSTSDGTKYNPSGKVITDKDMGTIWEGISLVLEKFIEWLLSLFGVNDQNSITAENTLPDQKTDGFVYESGFSEGTAILLALAIGGALMANGVKTKKSK